MVVGQRITEEEALARLRRAVEGAGSQAEYARQKGLHQGRLNQMCNGKRPMDALTLSAIGLKQVIQFEVIQNEESTLQEQYRNKVTAHKRKHGFPVDQMKGISK